MEKHIDIFLVRSRTGGEVKGARNGKGVCSFNDFAFCAVLKIW